MAAKKTAPSTYTLKKFTAEWCPPCKAMKKARVLEKFAEAHPDVACSEIDCDDPKGGKLAEKYDVRGIPTVVIEDAKGKVLVRIEGGVDLKALEAQFTKAVKKTARAQAAGGNRSQASRDRV